MLLLLSMQLVCRMDDLEVGLKLLSQIKKDDVSINLVMCRCVIGKCIGFTIV